MWKLKAKKKTINNLKKNQFNKTKFKNKKSDSQN